MTELVRAKVLYVMEYDVSIPADSKDSADCENHQGDSLPQLGAFPVCRLKKKKKKKNLYWFKPLRVAPSDAKSCLLSMGALSTTMY